MPFERYGWSVEQIDVGTRRWVYIARDAKPATIQTGAVRIDPNLDADSNPIDLFGIRGVEQMEAAAKECLQTIQLCLRDRARKGDLGQGRK